jgi:hypothetical protein
MVNVTNVIAYLLERVKEEYKYEQTICTPQEKDIAYQLFVTLQSVLESPGVIEKETSLDLAESYEIEEYDESETEFQDESSQESQSSQEWEFFVIDQDKYELDYMKRAVECYDKKGWKSTQHNFRRIKHQYYISRFREYIAQQGTRSEKMAAIDKFVYDKFIEAIDKKLIVHDNDLKRWALLKKRDIKFDAFVASKSWVNCFKRKNRIVSRKITKYVSVPQVEESESIEEISRNFVQNAITKFEEYRPDHILNTDQSGFT